MFSVVSVNSSSNLIMISNHIYPHAQILCASSVQLSSSIISNSCSAGCYASRASGCALACPPESPRDRDSAGHSAGVARRKLGAQAGVAEEELEELHQTLENTLHVVAEQEAKQPAVATRQEVLPVKVIS